MTMTEPVEIEPVLRQKLAYDIAPDQMLVDAATMLGLHPASPEVVEMEQRDSQTRRNAIKPLSGLLTVMARLSSEVIASAILVRQQETGSNEVLDPAATPQEILAASFAILANLVDMGLVHLPHPGNGASS